MFQRVLLLVLVLLTPAAGPAAAGEAEARDLISRLESEAIAMASSNLSIPEKERRFRVLLDRDFDMPGISQFILGRAWRTASPIQRTEFIRLFQDITTDIWVPRFRDYGGERLRITSIQPSAEGYMVETRVQGPRGTDKAVSWRLTDTPSGMKVGDIIVDGVSMALTHRSEYSSALRAAGGMDGLLGRMRQQLAASPH